ncbi:MAG: M50 family metallopeptidase [Clostridia bacterium]|nr:M50 family metallopeptidase [Clostridia bacterium]
MKKFKFIIHPLFIIFACVLVALNYFFLLISYLLTVILHEFAHAFVANKLGYKLNQINLMPHGASLSGDNRFFSARDEILVAIAGPLLNLILAVLGCAFWWLFPTTYFYTQQFVYANVITAVINCLPIFPLDGGRVLLAVLSKNGQRTQAIKKVRMLGIILSSLILVGFVITVFFVPNYTMLIFGSFLFVTSILEDKRAYYSHIGIFESKTAHLNKGLKMRSVAVPDTMPLYKLISSVTPDSLTEFTVIDEEYKVLGKINEAQLQNLIQIYPANTTLKLVLS